MTILIREYAALTQYNYNVHRRRINTEEKDKVVAAAWGRVDRIASIPCRTIAILHQDDLKKRIKRITAILGIEKINDHPVHSSQNGCSPKNVSSNHPCC